MAEVRETFTVDGIYCMQCVGKIAAALGGVDGLVGGSATLTGDVHVVYDDAAAGVRGRIEQALAGAGFAVVADA
jgi:copper chaperone CopZ